MNGIPCACATSASASRSAISPDGFAIVSTKSALVFSVTVSYTHLTLPTTERV